MSSKPSLAKPTPDLVTEQTATVRAIQPRGTHRSAVFLTHPSEALTYQYERNPADPRVTHKLTLAANRFGIPIEDYKKAAARLKFVDKQA